MTIAEKISALRGLMAQEHVDAYIVPGTDPHQSEYMAEHWQETAWLTGFKGEAATVVVTAEQALLWTDSRYYLQAGIELKGTEIVLMRESDVDCPSVADWLCELKSKRGGLTVGVNPEMWSIAGYEELGEKLTLKSIDLIRPIWSEGRPAIPETEMYDYDVCYAGESKESKLTRMREAIVALGAKTMVINATDEIAWLLNIRGADVEYNPVVISYCVLEQDKVTLFRGETYEDVYSYLETVDGPVLIDPAKVNQRLFESIRAEVVRAKSPILLAKSHKNEVELAGERKAMLQDSVALTKFFRWLEQDAFRENEHLTEWDLMEKLHSFRAEREHFVMESFGTIAGYKGNGAIVHYAATADNCAEVKPEGMLLLDSGGQYLDGTTDITRCVWLGGEIDEQAKRDYTYVLKGHIALGTIRWPRGTRGNQLDALAKQYMWRAGITYGHGTGHGVGHFLGCHEGPQNVRTDMNPTVLEAGQICSDEPGIYRTGKWGVRIENLVAVTPVEKTEVATTEDEWLTWEHLTLCYYDRSLIDMSLMTAEEIAWIDAYHKRVYELTAPLLTADEAEWLKEKCEEL